MTPARIQPFERAAALLSASQDPAVRDLGEKLRQWVTAGADESLDRALGTRCRGGITAHRAMTLAERNRMLRAVAASAFGSELPCVTARLMKLSFDRYEATRWPRERAHGVAPLADPAATWWRLLSANLRCPKVRRLTDILTAIQSPV